MTLRSLKELIKISSFPVVIVSLCCLSPLVLVLFGLSTVSFASSLSDTLYGDYKWIFRGVGLILLTFSILLYLRRSKKICTLKQAKRRLNEVVNTILLVLIVGVFGYMFFLYVVVHYAGVFLGIWT